MRARRRTTVICGIVLCLFGAAADAMDAPMTPSYESLEQVLEQHRDAIMAMPHVVGVGIGKCGVGLCIKVLVTECGEELEEQLETLLEGHAYSIEQTEPLQTLPSGRES